MCNKVGCDICGLNMRPTGLGARVMRQKIYLIYLFSNPSLYQIINSGIKTLKS